MEMMRIKIARDQEMMPVYIENRFVGTVLIGKSGTGKSVLILSIWEQDDYCARILIDPSGTLADQAYALSKDAIYVSLKTPVSLNLMDSGYKYFQICESLREALNLVITNSSNQNKEMTIKMISMFDRGVRACLERGLKSLENVKDWIINMQEKGVSEARDGLIQRLNFLLVPEMLPLLCGKDSVKLADIIKNKKSLILSCKGMGKEKMIFCGATLAQMINMFMRYDEPSKPCSIMIDEAQNFISSGFMDAGLREGRKYGLSILLSTQSLAGMPNDLVHLMLNSGNLITFQVGHREASYFARELDMRPTDIQYLEKYHLAYLTGNKKGIAKAYPPPYVPKIKIQAKPQNKSEPLKWFPLEPLEAQ